jgi:hypothetical protein
VHEEIEGVVHVVRRQAVFALRLSLDVVAVGVYRKTVVIFIEECAAAGIEDVVGPRSIL